MIVTVIQFDYRIVILCNLIGLLVLPFILAWTSIHPLSLFCLLRDSVVVVIVVAPQEQDGGED